MDPILPAIVGGRRLLEAAKHRAHVSLARESGCECEIDEWLVRFGETFSDVVDTKPAHVVADAATVVMPERTRDVRRMHTDRGGNIGEGDRLVKPVVEQISDPEEPVRSTGVGTLSRDLCRELEQHPFDRQRGEIIGSPELAMKLTAEASDLPFPDRQRIIERRPTIGESLEPRGRELNGEQRRPGATKRLRMRLPRRMKRERARHAVSFASRELAIEDAANNETDSCFLVRVTRHRQPGLIPCLAHHHPTDPRTSDSRPVQMPRRKWLRHLTILHLPRGDPLYRNGKRNIEHLSYFQ